MMEERDKALQEDLRPISFIETIINSLSGGRTVR